MRQLNESETYVTQANCITHLEIFPASVFASDISLQRRIIKRGRWKCIGCIRRIFSPFRVPFHSHASDVGAKLSQRNRRSVLLAANSRRHARWWRGSLGKHQISDFTPIHYLNNPYLRVAAGEALTGDFWCLSRQIKRFSFRKIRITSSASTSRTTFSPTTRTARSKRTAIRSSEVTRLSMPTDSSGPWSTPPIPKTDLKQRYVLKVSRILREWCAAIRYFLEKSTCFTLKISAYDYWSHTRLLRIYVLLFTLWKYEQ